MSGDNIPTESWNSSNFDRHCTKVHLAQEIDLKTNSSTEAKSNDLTENNSVKAEDPCSNEGKDSDNGGEDIQKILSSINAAAEAETRETPNDALGELKGLSESV